MKKSLIFAGLIAMVAIVATSCDKKPQGDAPKARFEYSVEDLTVTFTNQSVDAETYAWDFGDGSAISAEENPIHEYATEGTYKVTLTAKNQFGEKAASLNVVVEKPLFKLKIDGNFADWDELPAELLAVAEVDDWAYLENLYKIKFISDKKKIYFYMEFNGGQEEGVDIVGPIDMMIDIDGDAAIGMDTWLWSPSGVDLLIEGSPYPDDDPEWPSAGYQDAGVFQWIGDTPDAWLWDPLDIAGAIEASEVAVVRDGVKAFEGAILRSSIPGMKAFNVGVFTSDANWDGETGSLPQITISQEDGSNNAQPMLHVILN